MRRVVWLLCLTTLGGCATNAGTDTDGRAPDSGLPACADRFAGTFSHSPSRPSTLQVHGTFGGKPFDWNCSFPSGPELDNVAYTPTTEMLAIGCYNPKGGSASPPVPVSAYVVVSPAHVGTFGLTDIGVGAGVDFGSEQRLSKARSGTTAFSLALTTFDLCASHAVGSFSGAWSSEGGGVAAELAGTFDVWL